MAVAWAGLLGVAGSSGAVTWGPSGSGWEAVADLTWPSSPPPALAMVVPLLPRRRRRPVGQPTAGSLHAAKEVLAEQVKEQWRTEAALRSPDDPAPIPVRWTVITEPTAADRPASPTDAPTGPDGDVTALAARFRAMERRRLAILGGPGSGKTTLAVRLVRHLLDTRAYHPDEPVPVLLPVADWDTTRFPHLHDWVAEQLAQSHPVLRAPEFGPDMPARLATGGHILLVLDGLDDLPALTKADVIAKLGKDLSRDDQVILTCRADEYEQVTQQAGDAPASALVVRVRPVDRRDAAAYLRHRLSPSPGDAWDRTLTDLAAAPLREPLTALADVCTTPLGLWLVGTAYAGPHPEGAPPPAPETFPDAAALRASLFDRLVEALIAACKPMAVRPGGDPAGPPRPHRHHDPARVRTWLGHLAHLMARPRDGSPPTRGFAWWRLARISALLTATTRIAVGLVVGLATCLVIGLMSGPGFGLAFGAVSGLVAGLVAGSRAESWQQENPRFAELRVRGHELSPIRNFVNMLGRGLIIGLTLGLGFGSVLGLTVGLMLGRSENEPDLLAFGLMLGSLFGLMVGAPAGLASGLLFGLVRRAEKPVGTAQAATPLSSRRAGRTENLLWSAMYGLTPGITAGAVTGAESGLVSGLMAGLIGGLAGGFVGGLMDRRRHAWPASLLAAHRLAFAGLLPRRLMPFLDDMHRLGLLQAVGPVYRFRHAELHDHLAAAYEREHLKG